MAQNVHSTFTMFWVEAAIAVLTVANRFLGWIIKKMERPHA
jgi:hypothetical protein